MKLWNRMCMGNDPINFVDPTGMWPSWDQWRAFGGWVPGTGRADDTWVWDGDTWTKKSSRTSPPGRHDHAMAYDAARNEIVVFGGYNRRDDTWLWDGSLWLPTPANEASELIATTNQTTRELTETAFLHTTLGLTAQQNAFGRTDFIRDLAARGRPTVQLGAAAGLAALMLASVVAEVLVFRLILWIFRSSEPRRLPRGLLVATMVGLVIVIVWLVGLFAFVGVFWPNAEWLLWITAVPVGTAWIVEAFIRPGITAVRYAESELRQGAPRDPG